MKKANLHDKDILNPEEAIAHFVLSRRKFYRFLQKNGKHTFIAMYKSRILIIRTELENYLQNNPEFKEEMANGRKNRAKA